MCELMTPAQWKELLCNTKRVISASYTKQRNANFALLVQKDQRLCEQLQECSRQLMEHVVAASKPIFDSMHEAG